MCAALTQVDKSVLISFERYQDLLEAYNNSKRGSVNELDLVGKGAPSHPPPLRAPFPEKTENWKLSASNLSKNNRATARLFWMTKLDEWRGKKKHPKLNQKLTPPQE
mgnify:CR=1 FL=1